MTTTTTITVQILTGNLATQEPTVQTRADVSRYVEMVRDALAERWPDAEIEIDVQRASGYCRPPAFEEVEASGQLVGGGRGSHDAAAVDDILSACWEQWTHTLALA
jgi:hypothetical protein